MFMDRAPITDLKFKRISRLLGPSPNIDTAHPIHHLRAAPPIAEQLAVALAAEYYGLAASARRLSGERDQNFRLTAADGHEYVLKITSPAEDRAVTRVQTDALLHLAAVEPGLPVPRVFQARNGLHELTIEFVDGSTRIVRLLSYLAGTPIAGVAASAALRSDLGRCAAKLAHGLRDVKHHGLEQKLLWDIRHAAELRPLVDAVPTELHRLVDRFLEAFETRALSGLQTLDRQLVHNDLNPYNVVVDLKDCARVAGIIDFGDLAFTARVSDLAIASAYQVADSEDPLAPACELIAAYHAVAPLEPTELDLLFDLMATRMVMSIVIGSWRAIRYPENREYILRNYHGAVVRLHRVANLSREQANEQIWRACRSE